MWGSFKKLVNPKSVIFNFRSFSNKCMQKGENMELKKRVKMFLEDTGATLSSFCRRMKISNTYYYMWMRGDIEFSDEIVNRITSYLDEIYKK